jgi:hypothetical protein
MSKVIASNGSAPLMRRSELVAFRAAPAIGGFLALVIVAGGVMLASPGPRQTHQITTSQIMLLYVGAEDCAPCRAWELGEKVAFEASAEFPRIIYREVKSSTLLDILKDENWADDLRGYRDQLGRDAGVPLWMVIVDSRVVQRGMGPAQWRSDTLPTVKALLH